MITRKVVSRIILSIALLIGFYSQSSSACSILPPDAGLVKQQMKFKIAAQLGIHHSQIPAFSITQPKLSFLKPLGAACQGIDTAYLASAYYFEKSYPNKTCKHKGVAVSPGLTVTSNIQVHDSTTCLGIPVPPTPVFSGHWINRNASTNHITKFFITGNKIRVFGKCHPRDCDWGKKTLLPTLSPNKKKAVYVHGHRTRRLTLKLRRGEIELRTVTVTRTPSGPVSSTRVEYFVRR